MRGIMRLSTFKDVAVVSGCGVGGGSLGYANTLYVPPSPFFQDAQWGDLADWERELAPHYAEAQRMLGVVATPNDDPADQLLKELGEHLGVGDTYRKTPVGIFFGEQPGETVPDPFFGGEGPDRTGCMQCGRCMVGCPHGAKNTLVKNYLWLAERRGATVTPDRTVTDIRPLGAEDGSDGYAVTSERSGMRRDRDVRTLTARGVIVAAGALGTNRLLQRCRLNGSLPRVSHRLGELVRTNSESILAVTVPEDYPGGPHEARRDHLVDLPRPAHAHRDRHLRPRRRLDVDALHAARRRRLARHAAAEAARPDRSATRSSSRRSLWPKGWSRRTIIVLVMQTLDNAIALRPTLTRSGDVRLQTEQDPSRPNPTFIPVANEAAEWLAKRTGGIAQSSVMEATMNIPSTAHILGGAVIGARSGARRRRRRPARVRLREPARVRRRGGAGERRRQPEPHDHRARRARDEPHPGCARGVGQRRSRQPPPAPRRASASPRKTG